MSIDEMAEARQLDRSDAAIRRTLRTIRRERRAGKLYQRLTTDRRTHRDPF